MIATIRIFITVIFFVVGAFVLAKLLFQWALPSVNIDAIHTYSGAVTAMLFKFVVLDYGKGK